MIGPPPANPTSVTAFTLTLRRVIERDAVVTAGHKARASLLVVSFLLGASSGCVTAHADNQLRSSESRPVSPAPDPQLISKLQREARREFRSGHYTKPDLPALGDSLDALAPLIVREADVGDNRTGSPVDFGMVYLDDDGRVRLDDSQPTIYAARRTVETKRHKWDQLGYFWWYVGGEPDETGATLTLQGVVMTLDESGFPFLWEPVRPLADVRAVFDSASFEKLARRPEGRAHATEMENGFRREAEPIIRVATIETTPVPTGPYIYLNSANRVTSVLCRCSPVKVDGFASENEYTLRPLSELQQGSLTLESMGLAWRVDSAEAQRVPATRIWHPIVPEPVNPGPATP